MLNEKALYYYLCWFDEKISHLKNGLPFFLEDEKRLNRIHTLIQQSSSEESEYLKLGLEVLIRKLTQIETFLAKKKHAKKEKKREETRKKLKADTFHIHWLAKFQLYTRQKRLQMISELEENDSNKALIRHLFRKQKDPSILVAILEKSKNWDENLFRSLYTHLLESEDEEIQAYLRLLSA